MAPEANAFEFQGYQNPTARQGQRTYVTMQGINIFRRAGGDSYGNWTKEVGRFERFTTSPLPMPQPGEFPGEQGDVVEEFPMEEMA